MNAWTSNCDHDEGDGDIFTWDSSKVKVLQTEGKNMSSFVKTDKAEVCPDPNKNTVKQKPSKSSEASEKKRFKPKVYPQETFVGLVLEYIEDSYIKDIYEANDMCLRLSGELMTVPQNEEEEQVMSKIVRDFVTKKVLNNQTYLRDNEFMVQYWLAGESRGESLDIYSSLREQAYAQGGESTYFHPFTGAKLNPIKPMTRPDYSTNPRSRKQCMRCYAGIRKRHPDPMWDWLERDFCLPTICSQKNPNSLICQFQKEPTFKLRGMCKDALMDTQYKLADHKPFDLRSTKLYHEAPAEDNIRGYVGPKGWVISRDKDKIWRMTHYHYKDLSLAMVTKNRLPLGRHKWRIENNVCTEGETSFAILQLSGCDDGEFTCDDGKCLDISQRCNNIEVKMLEFFKRIFHTNLLINLLNLFRNVMM